MELVLCNPEYWEIVYSLRINFKESFLTQKYFSLSEHEEFMSKNSQNYYICLLDKKPIGFIGTVSGDVRIAVCELYQKKGVGKFMLEKFLEKHPKGYARIKIDNEKSIKLFESCGFKKKHYILEK